MGRFQVGGAVRSDAWYGRRHADDALPRALLRGEWAAVLAPRQMGKSSLRVRTASVVFAHARVAAVDLAALGSAGVDAAGWFAGLAGEVAAELGADDPAETAGPPARGWLTFLEGLLQAGPLVLFLDEIDVLRRLPFAADVLGSLRAAHERGATQPLWRRLSVCLVGAVTPDTLAAAGDGAPFNVGTRIALADFDRTELVDLEASLGRGTVDAIFAWTHGHPYMTARLGAALAGARGDAGDGVGTVDALVQAQFLEPGGGGETNLAAAERELLLEDGGAPERLETYRRALRGPVPTRELRPALVDTMVLSGMVAVRAGALEPRNRVVREVFDERWADRRLGQRSIGAAVRLWSEGGRRDEDLPRGQTLAGLRQWSEGRSDLTPEESRLLLRASEVLAEEASLRGAEERRIELEDLARSRGRMVAALGVLSVALAVGGVLLVRATGAARSESRRSTELRLAAEAVAMADTPRLGTRALRRALDAVAVDPAADPPEVTRALATVLGANQGFLSRAVHPTCPGGEPLTRGLTDVMDGAEATAGPDDDGPRRLTRVTGPDGRAWAWEATGGVLTGPEGVRTRLLGHRSGGVRWAAFTTHGLLTLGHDDTLRRWDLDSGLPLGAFLLLPAEPRTVTWCPDGLAVWTTDDAGRVGTWGIGAAVGALAADEGVPGAAWSGDGVLTVGADLTPRWRDPVAGTDRAPGGPALLAWEVSPSGRSVFAGDAPEVRTGGRRVPLPGRAAPYPRASWSADGARVVAVGGVDPAGGGREVAVWDVATATQTARWVVPGATGTPVFGPDGSVAIGDEDGAVHILGGATFATHTTDVTAVAFAPDGARIASASLDHTVVLRSLRDHAAPVRLLGHASHVRAVAWSADGRWVASGGDDQTVRLWDAQRGVELASYTGHTGVVRSVAFSPDGRRLLSTGDDGLVLVFPGSPGELVTVAAARLAAAPGEGGV